jgi:hypothetical protein
MLPNFEIMIDVLYTTSSFLRLVEAGILMDFRRCEICQRYAMVRVWSDESEAMLCWRCFQEVDAAPSNRGYVCSVERCSEAPAYITEVTQSSMLGGLLLCVNHFYIVDMKVNFSHVLLDIDSDGFTSVIRREMDILDSKVSAAETSRGTFSENEAKPQEQPRPVGLKEKLRGRRAREHS